MSAWIADGGTAAYAAAFDFGGGPDADNVAGLSRQVECSRDPYRLVSTLDI
jgi:hypothetical protein